MERNQIEEIKSKLDIVTVAEKYVQGMKKSGANYFALCPFHSEKTPSFSINQELQIYKCFGCGESGDVITFIEKLEGVDFQHALEMAAKMAGVTLSFRPQSPKQKKEAKEKEELLKANDLAMNYWQFVLEKHSNGLHAREYCKDRKLTKEVREKYKLGFAPKGYENLKKFLVKRGYKEDQLVKWGLLVSKNGRVYDKFRNRLMFPIQNNQGDVIGFSGREIEKTEFGPKYLNSPETPVYKKKESLYGIYQAKDAIRHKDSVVLVEGNVDVISSFRVGVENIVCPLGTALTTEQMRLLKRYASKVLFALDTDEAGEKALLRALNITSEIGIETYTINIGEFKDVDEMVVKSPDKWKDAVEHPEPVMDHLIRRYEKVFDLTSPRERSKFIKALTPYLKTIKDEIEQNGYIKKVSAIAEVEEELVRKSLMSIIEAKTAQHSEASESKEENAKVFKLNTRSGKKAYLASLLLQNPEAKLELTQLINIFEPWFIEVIERLRKGEKAKDLINGFSGQRKLLVEDLLLNTIDLQGGSADEVVAKTYIYLKLEKVREQIKELEFQIKKAEMLGEDITPLLEQVDRKTKELSLPS